MKKSPMDLITGVLLLIGGLNWGLVGVADINVINTVLGRPAILEKILYVLIGLAAFYVIIVKRGKCCPK